MFEKSGDVPVKIGIPKIVIEHPDGDVQVLKLRLLITTIFPKAGQEAEFEGVKHKRSAMQERHDVGLSGSCNLSCSAAASAGIKRHE
ncbi:hypothetical protein LPA44_12075 [Halobacterium sp. KA-4]|nr:hypothetical protein [Halobacterium sp. KA-4]